MAISGISGKTIFNIVKNENDKVKYIKNIDDIIPELENIKKDGDVILTLGAGNISRISHEYAKKLLNS